MRSAPAPSRYRMPCIAPARQPADPGAAPSQASIRRSPSPSQRKRALSALQAVQSNAKARQSGPNRRQSWAETAERSAQHRPCRTLEQDAGPNVFRHALSPGSMPIERSRNTHHRHEIYGNPHSWAIKLKRHVNRTAGQVHGGYRLNAEPMGLSHEVGDLNAVLRPDIGAQALASRAGVVTAVEIYRSKEIEASRSRQAGTQEECHGTRPRHQAEG